MDKMFFSIVPIVLAALSASTFAAPGAFPHVSAETQASRDDTRRSVLEQELASEATALQEATKSHALLLAVGRLEEARTQSGRADRARRNMRELQKEIALTLDAKTHTPDLKSRRPKPVRVDAKRREQQSPRPPWWDGYGRAPNKDPADARRSDENNGRWDGYGETVRVASQVPTQDGVETDAH
ncbi:MAG: hypothetical protein FHP92_14910 [Denitromonas halophila]|nr:MAG: hypothetical protein FHP92_14910 [Denitromonas halophila]